MGGDLARVSAQVGESEDVVKRLGLIVNPVAGLGGRVGLKGSDGAEIQSRALALGAVPLADARATEALRALVGVGSIELLTGPGALGAEVAVACGLVPRVVDPNLGPDRSTRDSRETKPFLKSGVSDLGAISNLGATTAADTRRIAREMLTRGVDLILFAGGDGTARDLVAAVGTEAPVLGVPAGVKMHSAVFALHPRDAGAVAVRFLSVATPATIEAEVLDLDEEGYRVGQVAPTLYGYLQVPVAPRHLQNRKAPSPVAQAAQAQSIAAAVVDCLQPGHAYALGPGTTTRAIAERLGLAKTLVGVDVVGDGALLIADANEAQLLELAQARPLTIVVAPTGGQGFLFGRGNQPFSPRVLATVGVDHILVVATAEKLAALGGRPLQVDTGDTATDERLAGPVRVITGYQDRAIYPVAGSGETNDE